MSARLHQNVTDEHRVEISRDNRTGTVYFRIRRHKRGNPISFTAAQWDSFVSAVVAGDLDWLHREMLRRSAETDANAQVSR